MPTDTQQRPSPVGGEPRPHARRTVIAAIVAFVVLLAAAVIGLVATRDRGGEDGARAPAATSVVLSTAAPSAPTTTQAGGGVAPVTPAPTSPPAEPVLADGRHPVYLSDIAVAGRTVEFDLIQFLTGDEAHAAWNKDHPDGPEGPPNGYYIINDNPKLRRLPVADDVAVTVLDWNAGFEPLRVAFADLPTHLADRSQFPGAHLGVNPFWLTVHDDTITAIEEQFLP